MRVLLTGKPMPTADFVARADEAYDTWPPAMAMRRFNRMVHVAAANQKIKDIKATRASGAPWHQ